MSRTVAPSRATTAAAPPPAMSGGPRRSAFSASGRARASTDAGDLVRSKLYPANPQDQARVDEVLFYDATVLSRRYQELMVGLKNNPST